MREEADPNALESLRRISRSEDAIEQGGRHAPRLVDVVKGEKGPAGDPIPLPEGRSHSWLQEPAEQERHHVFVSERELVFFFEGKSATAVVGALSRSPGALKAAVRWRGILAGRPRPAEERFAWTRTS
jgi:hypothetical protein